MVKDRISIMEGRKILRAQATEAQIQDAITQFLRAQRIPHTVTDATQSFNHKGQRVRRVSGGWPDITGCMPYAGTFIAIECKSAKGKLRPEQARALYDLCGAGALVCVARSVDDVIAVLSAGRVRDCDLAEIRKYKDKPVKRKRVRPLSPRKQAAIERGLDAALKVEVMQETN